MIRKTLRAACQHVRISPYEPRAVLRISGVSAAKGCHLVFDDPKIAPWTWD
jgi:hypothetical protein